MNHAEFVSSVSRALEQLGVEEDALALAEMVALCRHHPQWAAWLPTGGGWVAVRPAGSRSPGPQAPMLWVSADTATELGARMDQADSALQAFRCEA